MDAVNNSSSPVARLIPVIIFFAGLIGLYYLYQYLFGYVTMSSYELIKKTQDANIEKPIVVTSDNLPVMYEGGEFTFSTWIFINSWAVRQGYNKSIVNIGGKNFDTLRIYIGGNKPKLHIRLQTKEQGQTPATGQISTNPISNLEQSLDRTSDNGVFNVRTMDSGLLDSSPLCDLPEIDLQRWVNLTVTVNGKSVDVYLDGKLARSCVLPSFYRVDSSYSATLLGYSGFGGQISTTMMYDTALNPEMVYKNYIAGPEPITGFLSWLSSFFKIGVNISIDSK